MKALIFSDSHIKDDSHIVQINQLCDYVELVKPKHFILNGDILDPWAVSWDEIISTDSWLRILVTCQRRHDDGLSNLYVLGNHDHTFKREWFPCGTVTHRYGLDNFVCVHGWQRDIVWGGLWKWTGIHPVAFWIADKFPWAMVRIYNLLFKKKTPAQQKTDILATVISPTPFGAISTDYINADWNLHVEGIWTRFRLDAQKRNRTFIIGHTHCPHVETPCLVADSGDFVDSFSWLEIDTEVKLRYLDDQT